MRLKVIAALVLTVAVELTGGGARALSVCGAVVTLQTHGGTTMRYSFAPPQQEPGAAVPITLVLLVGGGGALDLDDKGCARALTGNSLVRMLPQFHAAGFVTALVDAPSDHPGEDGLGGFRLAPEHAEDIGKVIADVRARTKGPVWLVGTSRGTISSVNAAARLAGASAPDGIVLTSALMSGASGMRKAWVADTVFDVRLEDIRVPVLVVGHAADQCVRSPAQLSAGITGRTNGSREQVVALTGGPGAAMNFAPGIDACIGHAPHGFVGQEAEMVAGIARFIRGGRF